MPAKPTEHQKHEYLDEHLPYMLKMVRYDIAKMVKPPFYLTYNAHFESFAVNARNVVKFLTNGDTGNFRACDFAPGFRARVGNNATLMTKLEEQVFHLYKERPRDPAGGKLITDNARAVHEWIEENFGVFLENLGPLRNLFNDKKAIPEDVTFDFVFVGEKPSASAADPTTVRLTTGTNATTSVGVSYTGSGEPSQEPESGAPSSQFIKSLRWFCAYLFWSKTSDTEYLPLRALRLLQSKRRRFVPRRLSSRSCDSFLSCSAHFNVSSLINCSPVIPCI